VKKAVNQTPAMVIAQNLLMRKLGLLQNQHQIESADFDHYIKLFAEGLTEEQAQIIRELLMAEVPSPMLIELADSVDE
jgi:hypothetical protein